MKQIQQHQHQHDPQQPTATAQQPAAAGDTPRKQQQRHHGNNGSSNRHFSADYGYAQQELRVATIAALSQQIKGKKHYLTFLSHCDHEQLQ
jgi:hypothetical protein